MAIDTYELDLIPQKVVLTPQSISAAGFFRNVSECGFSDWRVGVLVEVTGLLCKQTGPAYPWFQAGQNSSYEIIGIGDGYLSMAELEDNSAFNGTSPQARTRHFTRYVFNKRD